MKATFFMIGSMVRRAPALAAEVAVHGDRHRSHLWRSPRDVATDLKRGHHGRRRGRRPGAHLVPSSLRPPDHREPPRRPAQRRPPGAVDHVGRDWRARATPASVAADVASHLEPGATVLLHDSDCTSAPGA